MNFDQNLSDLIKHGRAAVLPVPDTIVPMISRSLRIPLTLDERLRALADERGVGATTLMREMLEAEVARIDKTSVVPLADVERVIASLARPA